MGEPSYWQHPLCLYYTPFPGLCQSFPAGAAGQFCKKPQGGDCGTSGWAWFVESPVGTFGRVSLRGPLSCPAKKLLAGGTQPKVPTGLQTEPLSLGYAEPAPLSGEPFSKLTRTTSSCALRVCRPQAAAGKFFKKRKKGLDKTGCVRYNTEAVSAVPELH